MTKNEHTNEPPNVRTCVLTYIRTGQTLYPLHNFVVRGDNNKITDDKPSEQLFCKQMTTLLLFLNLIKWTHRSVKMKRLEIEQHRI